MTKATTKALERKFEETAFRLSQERSDFFLPQILDFVSTSKWINLRPEYQRRLVWDAGKRSRFIESLLLNVPIPSLFLYEWDLNRYEVMDGQQRLNAVVDFYENGYALKGLERWEELNGMRYRDMPETLKRGLDRRRLSASVLLIERGANANPQKSDVRKLVFERLNTGGQELNAQELRNCLYSSPFNEMLIRVTRNRAFAEVWEIPPYEDNVDREGKVSTALAENRLYRRMIDAEIVLRYFAFSVRSKIRGAVRGILDKCMEDHLGHTEAEVVNLEQEFLQHLGVAKEVFGQQAFRIKDEKGSLKLSQPLYDGEMQAIRDLWPKRAVLLKRGPAIRRSVAKLLDDDDAHAVIVGRPNTAKAIVDRLDLIKSTIAKAAKP